MQHGKPRGVAERNGQPEAREGGSGRDGVAEGLVVPMKPGNAGGGKRPRFKVKRKKWRGIGDWET